MEVYIFTEGLSDGSKGVYDCRVYVKDYDRVVWFRVGEEQSRVMFETHATEVERVKERAMSGKKDAQVRVRHISPELGAVVLNFESDGSELTPERRERLETAFIVEVLKE